LAGVLLKFGVVGGLLGASIGAALRAIDPAGLAALIGGIPLAVIGAFALGWYGFLFGAVNRVRHGPLFGVVLGLLGGGFLGVVAGLMALALPWSLVGALIGGFLVSKLTSPERRPLGSVLGVLLGICGGILHQAHEQDQEAAAVGALYGLLLGMVAGPGLFLALIGSLERMPRMPRQSDPMADEPDGFDEGDGRAMKSKMRRKGR
jgi:hypothetical protein